MDYIEEMPCSAARNIRFVLTDIDDTLTRGGKLMPEAYAALWKLKDSGLRVVAVTGRAAAWGYLLAHEWPVSGVVTENGAVTYFIRERQRIESIVYPGARRNTDSALRRAMTRALEEFPRAKEAQDNHLRLYDLAVDYAENICPPLGTQEAERIARIFHEGGCHAQPSSIHVNAWAGEFNKKEASVLFLSQVFDYDDRSDREKVLYVGDALNDEPMFAFFPNTCAVANIKLWEDRMTSLPRWVSRKPYGEGFAEIAGSVISKRNRQDA